MFAEESEHDQTFNGFSDHEVGDLCDPNGSSHQNGSSEAGLEDVPDPPLKKEKNKTSSKRSGDGGGGGGGARQFTLRVSLRLRSHKPHAAAEDAEVCKEEEEMEVKEEQVIQKKETANPKKRRRVKFEEEEQAVAPLLPIGSDSEGESVDTFLSKRDQNIKANKAMLAQLMADLQKMPGGAGILKKHTSGKKPKEKGPHPPRSGQAGGESRRNPERGTRRQTRSMGGSEDPSGPRDQKLELSLEDELLEVRNPRRRYTPRPSQTKPHTVRPVQDITEAELQLVADNMTEKVYNSVTGSTCHQCRQKTIDTKTCCRSKECRGIQGQFCGPCLRNRYGEDVKQALLDPEWQCPPCRHICNCSFCRLRDGRCPTGILLPLAQYHGFSDVHSYLSSLRNKLESVEEDL
ncbi:hypothetical protein NHX12_030995 [Muraenolepis orangiensis]|uniref:Zinc-finger domain-containing protein n=1 Tax=Muraenolepis orangiensis TaxID=630683 RepID=A0A9Q0IMD4_9TELE|nr:hypothetical protein NHX12_030995 [Muraenolepis orangiensis]